MDRTDLQRLSKDELIELVIQLQRPDKTSRNSSKPPSTDKKEKRENSRPGGAKPGHEPHNRRLADNPDEFRDHSTGVRSEIEQIHLVIEWIIAVGVVSALKGAGKLDFFERVNGQNL